MIDWNANYQKTFRLVHPPFSNEVVSIVTTHNGKAWDLWKPIDDSIIQYWKENWNTIQRGITDYKLYQILNPKPMHNKMILTAESDERKITIELPADSTTDDFLEACKVLALGVTYQEASWNAAIGNAADDINYRWQTK